MSFSRSLRGPTPLRSSPTTYRGSSRMSSNSQHKRQLPVLIIGAGVGGLTLAHSLAKHNIAYKIYERDASQFERAQGYRVSIDDGGNSALKMATTPEVFQRHVEMCGENHTPVGRVDARTGKLLQGGLLGLIGTGGWSLIWALLSRYAWTRWMRLGTPQPSPIVTITDKEHRQVDRQVLRSILLPTVQEHLAYHAAFTSYTLDPHCVTAHFADGSSADGSLLVGADGIRSKVAAQLTTNAAVALDLGVRIIYGKSPLTSKLDSEILPLFRTGVCFIRDEQQDMTVVMVPMRFNHPDAPHDYIFWAMSSTAERLGVSDEGLLAAQGNKAKPLIDSIVRDWHPKIKLLFEQQIADQTAVLKMTSSHPDNKPSWNTERRVTVLGDAVHCMPPTGGQGANSALHDAAALGEILSRSEDYLDGWSKETIAQYEDVMRWNPGDVVGLACVGANGLFGAKIPE